MSDEADNLVLRHLRELRERIDSRFDDQDIHVVKVDGQLADLRGLVLDTRAQMATRADLHGITRRLDDIETHLRLADRVAEPSSSKLQRRLGS